MADGALRVLAPAKINLHLAVGGIRPDGYHDVVTVLHALAFGDTVTIRPATRFAFVCDGMPDLSPEDNLAWRAAHQMAARLGRRLDVAIAVDKRIPAGGGLGGASADAAAVITGLAAMWGLPAHSAETVAIARELGADVPFFLTGGCALFSGRGDVLERGLRALEAPIVLVKPTPPVHTAEAYRMFDALPPAPTRPTDAILAALEAGDAQRVAAGLFNNLTGAAVSLVPDVGEALDDLQRSPGVAGAAVAGSGSTVFGVCVDASAAERVMRAARDNGLWAAATSAVAHGCLVEPL